MGEDVADLADCDDLAAARGQPVEQRRLRRRHGIVAAVVGALEGSDGFADKRPSDHPPDVQRIDQPAHRLAELVEPLQAEMRFVRGDLQDEVDRGVADRLAGADMLLAEPLDDLGSRRMAIAENARHLAFADHRFGQFGRKGRHRLEGNSPSRSAPAGRRFPNDPRACPCHLRPPAPRHGRPWQAGSCCRRTESRSRFPPRGRDRARPCWAPRAALCAGLRDPRGLPRRPRRCVRTCSAPASP